MHSTLDQRFVIQLAELENVDYLLNDGNSQLGPTDFVLEFRDGRCLYFRVGESRDDELERDEWIQRIEESHDILQNNPIPAWTIV